MDCNKTSPLKVSIDASNLLDGGGRTHLMEFLSLPISPLPEFEFTVFGTRETLNNIEDHPSIIKKSPYMLSKNGLCRFIWRLYYFSKDAKGSDLLFSPGGSIGYTRGLPSITMCRNMLPFESKETNKFGLGLMWGKLKLLRLIQSISFRKATGVIFLTRYAKKTVESNINYKIDNAKIIPHGLNDRFLCAPKKQRTIEECCSSKPFQIIYVSPIDVYKYQWAVVEALAILREDTGWNISLILIGSDSGRQKDNLNEALFKYDPRSDWVKVLGKINYKDLHHHYKSSDAAVFASSCENLPNTLIEMMGAGLPVACSKKGPMPEILGESEFYFDPENVCSIEESLASLIRSPLKREAEAESVYSKALNYSWERCRKETLDYIKAVKEYSDQRLQQ